MSHRPLRRVSPVQAFERVTMRQAVIQRCNFFTPTEVEAGADREITVGVELENTTDDEFDHVWRIEIDGDGIGFTTTTVPPGETVTDSQTQVIPEGMLPVDGGSLEVAIQQIGGQRQTSVCGDLTVEATEAEPVPEGDIVLTDLHVPSTVTEGETVTIEIETQCVDGFCEQETLTLTVGGSPVFTGGSTGAGPFEQGRTRTFTADVMFDSAGTVDVVAEIDSERLRTTVDVQAPEPVFDPGQVFVPTNDCGVSPQEIAPPADVSLSATVRNRNDVPAAATVEWTWEGQVIAQAGVNVSAGSFELTEATATIEREGRGQVRGEVVRASESAEGLRPMSIPSSPANAFTNVFS
jgi:hypothetical protein